jgi:hypothetical protein
MRRKAVQQDRKRRLGTFVGMRTNKEAVLKSKPDRSAPGAMFQPQSAAICLALTPSGSS